MTALFLKRGRDPAGPEVVKTELVDTAAHPILDRVGLYPAQLGRLFDCEILFSHLLTAAPGRPVQMSACIDKCF